MSGWSFFRTIQVKLIIIYVLLMLVAMQLIAIYFISTVKNSLTMNFTTNLKEQANALSTLSASQLSSRDAADTGIAETTPDDLTLYVRNLSGAEIQVLDASGRVLTTSQESHQQYVGKKNTSLVVSRALQGIRDNEQDIIDEDNVHKKVIAQPVMSSSGKVLGAVYIVASMSELNDTVERVNRIFVSGTLIALGLTAVLCVLLAHTITSPIKVLTRRVSAVAEGRFDELVPVLGDDEIGRLSEAFNEMTQRLQEALSINEEEKEKLASILSNMSDGVIAADEKGTVIVSNRRAQEMLGVPVCEGYALTELLGLPPEKELELSKGIEHSTLVYMETSEEDDSEGWMLRITFSPIRRRGQGITGTIAVLQDVTEQEKLEQSRREFVANVSHELRTPLTTIRSYAEALDDGALDDRQLSERFVGVIRNETERMIRLVSDLLNLSRFDSSQSKLRYQQTDIREMLEEVADRFSVQMRNKTIRAIVLAEDGVGKAVFDRDQIDQVLDNLVSNAIKYTPDGGHVELEARRQDNGHLAISVRDNGIGVPKKDLSRIFDRFYRVDKARSREMGGTGLGLSIAREIIKAHGGSITLESEPQYGTTVTFTLPDTQEGSGPA